MKIVHICLAARYVEGFGYQENIIPQIHKDMGHEVLILTSEYEFDNSYNRKKRESNDYINNYGIRVKSLKKSKRYGYISRFNDYDGIKLELEKFSPDIIFVHGGQFLALKDVISYCKKNKKIKLYIDQHADYYNTSIENWKSRIVQKNIYGRYMRKAVKYAAKFWGVTPWRCQYLHEVYGIPLEKIELLIMGGDDRKIDFYNQEEIRKRIREQLDLKENDFVIISGGKINRAKNIHRLMEAVSRIREKKIRLVVFGQPLEDIKKEFLSLSEDSNIKYIQWINSDDVYDYFLSADLAVFPGTHSVLWEQACACGIPTVFKDWKGMHHVDAGGNCVFLDNDSVECIKNTILDIYFDKEKYLKLKKKAIDNLKVFSYVDIAKRAIEFK